VLGGQNLNLGKIRKVKKTSLGKPLKVHEILKLARSQCYGCPSMDVSGKSSVFEG
jgi:hypothetical protein